MRGRHRQAKWIATGIAVSAASCALLLAPSASATSSTTAEILSSNLFMGTTKVEVGSRANASFGSTVNAPAGYHPRPTNGATSGILGFRGNPTECDWNDPACEQISQGDFFVPGTPYEAWALQIGSGTAAVNSNMMKGIAGSFTAVDATKPGGTWEATAPYDGIQVRFDYSVPTYSWLVDAYVTLTNATGSTINDIYFLRGVDPDNCKTDPLTGRPPPPLCTSAPLTSPPTLVTDTFATFNTVKSNGPETGTARVIATQTDETYISLQVASNTAKAFRKTSGFANTGNLANIYAGSDVQYFSDVDNTVLADEAMYIVEKISSLGPGASTTIPIKYVLKEGAPVNPPKTLTVTKGGDGTGTVTSDPVGIDCGSTCTDSFDADSSVTLTAAPADGSSFTGWTGACTGAESTCTVTMSEDKAVTATFATVKPPAGKPKLKVTIGGPDTVLAGRNFTVGVRTTNQGSGKPTPVGRSARAAKATSVKTCLKVPDSLFVVGAQKGAKSEGKSICWTRSSLGTSKWVSYKVTLRSSASFGGSESFQATANAKSTGGATVSAKRSSKVQVREPKPAPKPKPPTG